ncbi:hypothetical protein KC207_16445 [Phycicoccus sp. BSK3Z-2]|uniref:Uncharacterized protein n=1 Tax=Phycicoccus avicenniae TaxID=2828860 RepID=A0A941DCE9_9MICO|nr:hypothetical protein [Phycicoccus avicenniae]MBR7744885.1 hypothetical protein [Phycicoccus avicenniae]
MTRTGLDRPTEKALRSLDPAPSAPDAPRRARADAVLERVLREHGVDRSRVGSPSDGAGPGRRRVRGRRRLVLATLAAASSVALVVLPTLGGDDVAYAGWTAAPQDPSTPDQVSAAASCRDTLAEHLDAAGSETGQLTASAVRSAGLVLAEDRGPWTLVVLAGDPGLSGVCVLERPGWFGRLTVFASAAADGGSGPGPRDVLASGVGGGSSGEGISVATGTVGEEVAAVTLHTSAGDVEATVHDGRLAAWWPGDPGRERSIPTTVTFSDGTSRSGTF